MSRLVREGRRCTFSPVEQPGPAAEERLQMQQTLLALAKWMHLNLPVLPRKSPIHQGMSGLFYVLGVHLSEPAR